MPETTPRKRPPSPQNHKIFDAWNSASTGHQRAKGAYAGTATWRDTRSLKLERQFRSGDCLREEDHVPSSRARAFDGICTPHTDDKAQDRNDVNGSGEWRWVSDVEAKRSQLGVQDIRSFMGVGKRKSNDEMLQRTKKMKVDSGAELRANGADDRVKANLASISRAPNADPSSMNSSIFLGATVFINGSTLPLISDHKLKRLLVEHGAQISIHMARKSVSHVIIGQPNAISNEAALGAGGGLSARKFQQEIARGGWKGVKIVGVEWILESIKAGKRLAESRFVVMNVAPKGQQSVAGMFGRR
ncbi:hypothetical protein N7490_007202 [Penicillium lividum]|nr:hypothetical protein N7490_007202 [Penicillium lividum]